MIPIGEYLKLKAELEQVREIVKEYEKPRHHVGTKAHLIVMDIKKILDSK